MHNKLVFFSDEDKHDFERFERFANKKVYNMYTQSDLPRIVVWSGNSTISKHGVKCVRYRRILV